MTTLPTLHHAHTHAEDLLASILDVNLHDLGFGRDVTARIYQHEALTWVIVWH